MSLTPTAAFGRLRNRTRGTRGEQLHDQLLQCAQRRGGEGAQLVVDHCLPACARALKCEARDDADLLLDLLECDLWVISEVHGLLDEAALFVQRFLPGRVCDSCNGRGGIERSEDPGTWLDTMAVLCASCEGTGAVPPLRWCSKVDEHRELHALVDSLPGQ